MLVCVFIVRLGKAAFTLAGGDIIGSVWRSCCSLRLKPSEGLWMGGGFRVLIRGVRGTGGVGGAKIGPSCQVKAQGTDCQTVCVF